MKKMVGVDCMLRFANLCAVFIVESRTNGITEKASVESVINNE